MRVLFLVLLTLALVGQTTAFFAIYGGIIGIAGGNVDLGLTTMDTFRETAVRNGGPMKESVVEDPFGILQGSEDDHGHKSGNVQKCPAIADIIFVFDTSSSKQSAEFELQKQFAIRITEHFKIGASDTRFGAVVFSDTAEVTIRLSEYNDGNALTAALQNTKYLGGGTSTYQALDLIRTGNLFNTSNGGRDKSSKIVIVITDRASDSLFKTNAAASALKSTGVQVISVGIGSGFDIELSNIASGYRNVFTADSFKTLSRVDHKIARRTCEIPAADGNIPSGSGEDSAPSGADACNGCDVDLLLVIDSSNSINDIGGPRLIAFLDSLVADLPVDQSCVRIAALQFSTRIEHLFYFNQFRTSEALRAYIQNNITHLKENTDTAGALDSIASRGYFTEANGARPGSLKNVLIITDRRPDNQGAAVASAQTIRGQGVNFIAAAIDSALADALADVVGDASRVFSAKSYNDLSTIESLLLPPVCETLTTKVLQIL